MAILPLRSRGLSPAEHKRIAARLATGFRRIRPDAVAPEDLAARLFRDERRRAALQEARHRLAEGTERSLNVETAAALAAYDRALQLYRENFGELVDPAGVAEAHLRRAIERLDIDPAAAKADLMAAAGVAPDRILSIDDFPPRVLEAYEAARAEKAREAFPADDSRALAALGAALGTATIAISRAERGDRIEEGIGVEVAIFAARIPDSPPRTARTVVAGLGEGLERVDAMLDSLAARGGPVSSRGGDVPRPDPLRTPPRVRRPAGDRPLWKNPWLWAGGGALALLGAGVGAYTLGHEREEGPGFKVILVPPEDS